MKFNAILGPAVVAASVAVAAFVGAQEAIPVSSSQFGEGATGEVSGQLSIFGGGDENGGLFGGAPSVTVPLSGNVGIQFDAIAGFVADEVGFAGGASQLFYRDPQAYTIGIAGAGYYMNSEAQYSVSGFGEYYIDNLTLEATVGYTMGKILDDQFYGRGGLSIYPNPNLRLGGGVTYSDQVGVGGDVQVEALLTDYPGVSLFAAGAFDQKGATGYGGIRFYFNGRVSPLSADPANAPSLIELHRNFGRPNFFLSDPVGFGVRHISHNSQPVNPPLTCANPPCSNTPGNLISTVQDTLGQLTDQTLLDPLTDLVNTLVDPASGALNALTGPLADLTTIGQGALGPLTELVQGLAGTQNSALTPLVDALNTVLAGLTSGADPSVITDNLSALPGAGQLSGLLGGLLP